DAAADLEPLHVVEGHELDDLSIETHDLGPNSPRGGFDPAELADDGLRPLALDHQSLHTRDAPHELLGIGTLHRERVLVKQAHGCLMDWPASGRPAFCFGWASIPGSSLRSPGTGWRSWRRSRRSRSRRARRPDRRWCLRPR